MIIIVTATRQTQSGFGQTPLGRSLQRIAFDKSLWLSVAFENEEGLPAVYNRAIDEEYREHLAVFVHDDVWLDDVFFADRVRSGLSNFDVIGVAGNRRLVPEAPAWHVKSNNMEWDSENLTGVVCHGSQPFGPPSVYGPTPAPAQLLDGVLLAARVSSLLDSGVRFDVRFKFHFYDLDFSRQANAAALKVGTWPIAVTHASGGAFGSASWKTGLEQYREKWELAAVHP